MIQAMAQAPVSIKLRCASWQQLAAIYKRDLLRGSIFLRSSKPPPVGTAVKIDLTLPTDSMIVLTGYIAGHVPPGGLGGRGPGVDVRLPQVPQSAMWLIETALASAQKGQSGMSQTSALQSIKQSSVTQAVASMPAADRPATDAGLEDGNDLAAAESELLAALGAEHESLGRLNPFQVLGVGYEAGDDDVRAAFGELTKRYHPDRFARYSSNELRNHAAEIFILIRDAYRRIGDARGRQQALAALGPRRTPKPGRAATAPAVPPPPPGPRPSAQIPALRIGTPPVGIPRMPTAPATPPPPPPKADPAPPEASLPLPTNITERRPILVPPPAVLDDSGRTDYGVAEDLIDQGKYDEALAVYKIYARKNPNDRTARAGLELAEGLRALAQRDRLEAAQRFEAVLELDPSNERAARELAEMRRQATNERKGLLSRLLGKKE
jgi:tetratricopeptide (TPR) repeat protein